MKITQRACKTEADYWQMRNFLRRVFMLNDRLLQNWHVAYLDFWRWHYILTCQEVPSMEVATLWETESGQLAALLTPVCHDEVYLQVHPDFRTPQLEDEMLAYAEEHHADYTGDGRRILYCAAPADDSLRQEVLTRRGYVKRRGWTHHWRRDLEAPIPGAPDTPGYTIRSMGALDEHPARSWASWRAFHAEEPDENYDGDCSWFLNLQSAPLYRRDLDIVAATTQGEIAAFCTIFYDDYTRSALCVLEGTAAEHLQRGLGQATILEGMRRLKTLGCTRAMITADDSASDALYASVMQTRQVVYTWYKYLPGA